MDKLQAFEQFGKEIAKHIGAEKARNEVTKMLSDKTEWGKLHKFMELATTIGIPNDLDTIELIEKKGEAPEIYAFITGLTSKEKWTVKTKVNKITLAKAGNGAISPKLSVPWKWLQSIGITEDERDIELSFDEENKKIILEKK